MTSAPAGRPVELAQVPEGRRILEKDTSLRVSLVRGERVVVQVDASDVLEIEGATGELRILPIDGGLLVVDQGGAEIVVQVAGGEASIVLDGRTYAVSDVAAEALQRIDPSQGTSREQPDQRISAPETLLSQTVQPPLARQELDGQGRGRIAPEGRQQGPEAEAPAVPVAAGEDGMDGRLAQVAAAVVDGDGEVATTATTTTTAMIVTNAMIDGDDLLVGSAGVDLLSGGAGDDTLCGCAGNDTLAGGADIDTADYSYLATGFSATLDAAGTAVVEAAPGDTDILTGVENLVGGLGADRLAGDGGANALSGGEGDDTLSGRGGDDTLDGGVDRDAADYRYLSTGITASLDSGSTATVTAAAGDTDMLVSVEDILGGTGDDWLFGDMVGNLLDGGAGDDILSGMDGDDSLAGGSGTDTADYDYLATGFTASLDSSGTATVTLAAGDTDVLAGIENILGGAGSDFLDGDGGANVLDGGGGDDTLRGHSGNDTLVGGDGNDQARYGYSLAAITATIEALGTVTLVVGAGDTDILVGIEGIAGSSVDDLIVGDGGANLIGGNTGNDTLSGRGGNDTLAGGANTDTADYAYLATGFTTSLDSSGTITITAAVGDTDTLSSIENIVGGGGNDLLTGDGIANTIEGGAGDDTLMGGAGNDALLGGANMDTADYSYLATGFTASLDSSGTATVVAAAGDTDTLAGLENLLGGGGDDLLFGDAGANTISGGGGADTISGGASGDVLLGGAGADTLAGDGGDDSLSGGAGADRLTGGGGADRFLFGADALDAADVIVDFEAGDALDFSALLESLGGSEATIGDYVSYLQNGADVEVWVDQNGTLPGGVDTLVAVVANRMEMDLPVILSSPEVMGI